MKTAGWSPAEDDGLPKFGRKGRHWFARRLRWKLFTRMSAEELASIVDRFLEDPSRYVAWEDDDNYHGPRYSNGSWVIDWDKVINDVNGLLAQIRADAESVRFATLDEWLRADATGTLSYSGARGGSANLPKKLRRELLAAARARRKGRPRICRTCRSEFTPTCNRAQRCPKCIDSDAGTNRGPARRVDRHSS